MPNKTRRWLIAAQGFQAVVMVAMSFGFFVMRALAGRLLDRHLDGGCLPNMTDWALNWGPADPPSALAVGLVCAATYLSLSLVAIVKSADDAQAVARCHALSGVWLIAALYLLVLLIAFALPFITVLQKIYLPGEPMPGSYVRPSSIDTRLWLVLAVLYLAAISLITRKALRK